MVSDLRFDAVQMFKNNPIKLAKGFIRLGHDVRQFGYFETVCGLSPIKNRTFARLFAKNKADGFLVEAIKNYRPDIIFVTFVRVFDAETVERCGRQHQTRYLSGLTLMPGRNFAPEESKSPKNSMSLWRPMTGNFLQTYRDAGVRNASLCRTPATRILTVVTTLRINGKRYSLDGLIKHDPKRYPGEQMRYEIVNRISKMPNCAVYGCCGKPKIGGMDYLYAISGAKIGLSINGDNDVRLYHSNRLTHYMAGGTCVLAKKVPGATCFSKTNCTCDILKPPKNSLNWRIGILSTKREKKNRRRRDEMDTRTVQQH